MESLAEKRERVRKIMEKFDNMYPEVNCTLNFVNPLQLLIATQLAAQCTDERVNMVTEKLFVKYKDVYDFANASQEELEEDIRATGFFRNKARNIIGCCRMLIDKYNGEVPKTMDELLELPGVGRKTANVILGNAFGIPGIVVDTHAKRLSNRIGLTTYDDPEKIEYDLREIVPEPQWTKFSHQLVYHGRAVCQARKPKCGSCEIREFCRYGQQMKD